MNNHSAISITLIFLCILQTHSQCEQSILLSYSDEICPCDSVQSSENGVCQSCLIDNCQLCSEGNHSKCDICQVGYGLTSDFTCIEQCQLSQIRTQKCKPRQSYYNSTGQCIECQVYDCILCDAEDPFLCQIYPETEPAIAVGISAAIFLGIPVIGLLMHCVTSRKSEPKPEERIESDAMLQSSQ